MTGIVKSYNNSRGFGLIAPLIGKPDSAALVFFHCSAIVGRKRGEESGLPTGAEVEFELVRGDRGPQAANVKLRTLNGSVLQTTSRDRVKSAPYPAPVAQTTWGRSPCSPVEQTARLEREFPRNSQPPRE
jgi:CspA family cold shock protein